MDEKKTPRLLFITLTEKKEDTKVHIFPYVLLILNHLKFL